MVVNYGIAAVGVVIGFGASRWEDRLIVEIIFMVFIPLLCNLTMFVWNGEVYRMSRAGLFIRDLEEKINREARRRLGAERDALSWEQWLREFKKSTGNRKSSRNYLAILGLFLLICATSALLGGYHYLLTSAGPDWALYLLGGFSLANMLVFIHHFRYFHQVKK